MSEIVDALNESLAIAGQRITIRRRVGTSNTFDEIECFAVVRGFEPNPLLGPVTQQESQLIMSPTPFEAEWNAYAGGSQYPQKGDLAIINGKPRTITAATTIGVGNDTVRVEAVITG